MSDEDPPVVARRTEAIVRTLVSLAEPDRADPEVELSVPTEWFRWLPQRIWQLANAPTPPAPNEDVAYHFPAAVGRIDRSVGLILDQWARADLGSVRVGWLWLAGRPRGAPAEQAVFLPLVSRPVRVDVGAVHCALAPLGPPVFHLAPDRRAAAGAATDAYDSMVAYVVRRLGTAADGVDAPGGLLYRRGELWEFVAAVTAAMDRPVGRLVAPGSPPEHYAGLEDPVVVVAPAVYVDRRTPSTGPAGLSVWLLRIGNVRTAFDALYATGDARLADDDHGRGHDRRRGQGQHRSGPSGDDPLPPDAGPCELSTVQAQVVASARRSRLTVVAGAPGTGKSQLSVALALDAVARGESVLVAVRRAPAVEALAELFGRVPGPVPVRFGSRDERGLVLAELEARRRAGVPSAEVAALRRAVDELLVPRAACRGRLAALLDGEAALDREDLARHDAALAERWPKLFLPDADLAAVSSAVADALAPTGWTGWRLRRVARHQALHLAGAEDVPAGGQSGPATGRSEDDVLAEVVAAVGAAHRARAEAQIAEAGGLTLVGAWAEAVSTAAALRDASARWLAAEVRSVARLDPAHRSELDALVAALGSGRAARRAQLASIGPSVVREVPLWLGTLEDVDDVLPASTALFDVAIVDEASSLDQPTGAGVFLRARRAVVVGDPVQLRPPSFVADARVEATIAANGLADDPVAARLDVRRNSVFDVAAAAAPVTVLDEQFRSAPRLVEPLLERLYGDRARVATRTPATEAVASLEIVRVAGTRSGGRVVAAEIDEVVRQVRRMRAEGAGSLGIVTPFRAQADALAAACRERVWAGDLAAGDVRVATAHGWQGNERDAMIVSLGVGADAGPGVWAFVEDPHVFSVLVSRARRRQVVVCSGEPPPGGLVAGYLASVAGSVRALPAAPVSAWAQEVAAAVEARGVPVAVGYRTGRHVVDVVVGDAAGFVGVETDVHVDGPGAHIDRHLALVRGGWSMTDAFRSRWAGRLDELAERLVDAVATR